MNTSVHSRRSAPQMSVVITSYDFRRRANLERVIASLRAQESKSFNLILVIEKNHEMYEYFKRYLRKAGLESSIVIFNDSSSGISASRNLGLSSSNSEVVAVIDDDVVVPTGWATAVFNLFANAEIIAASGPVIPLWEDESLKWLRPEFHWLIGCSTWSDKKTLSETRNVWGANMAFRRAVLLKIGGFSQRLGGVRGKRLHGEENDLCLRLRRISNDRIVFSPEMELFHSVSRRRFNIHFILRSSFDMGRTRVMYANEVSALRDEVRVAREIAKDAFRSIMLFPVKPRRSFSMLSLSSIVLLIGGVGYIYGRALKA